MTNPWNLLTYVIPERKVQAEPRHSVYYTYQEEPIEVHSVFQNMTYSMMNILIFLVFFTVILFFAGLVLSQINLQKLLAPAEFSALSQTVGAESAARIESATPEESKRAMSPPTKNKNQR